MNRTIKALFDRYQLPEGCTHADLTAAILAGADLTHADLTHADLTAAILAGADLTHADLTAATYTDTTMFPADFDPDAHGMTRRDAS